MKAYKILEKYGHVGGDGLLWCCAILAFFPQAYL